MAGHLLQNVYLFKEFTPDELAQVESISRAQAFSSGESLFTEGQDATAMYIIKYGSVQVAQSGDSNTVMLATLGTGSHLGEMAFIDGEKRSATARVMEQSEIVVLDYAPLRKLLDAQPSLAAKFYRELAHYLSGRLRSTSSDLQFARSRGLRHT